MSNSTSATGGLRFSSVVTREPHPVGARCMIRQFRHTDFGGAMSPLVLVDHFVMTGPTFELHPHAGMSAVTILFEDTKGWMSSHDSIQNDHLIEPGDLHWTLAGKGIVHTQQPEGEQPRLDGLQLFVNLPRRLKRLEPATLLLSAGDAPVIDGPGIRLRILAGEFGGQSSPLETPEPILIVDGSVDGDARTDLPLPPGWNLWLYVREGGLSASDPETLGSDGVTLSANEAVAVSTAEGGTVALRPSAAGARFVAIAGPAIDEPVVQAGPFVMSSQDEVRQAVTDFQAGRFGTVKPFA